MRHRGTNGDSSPPYGGNERIGQPLDHTNGLVWWPFINWGG